MENDKTSAFIVTEEAIRDRAIAYVPIAEKQSWVGDVVVRCFDPINIAAVSGVDEMPPMYKENTFQRVKYLAGALLKLYLCEDFAPVSEDDPWMMPDDTYDFFCADKPLAQIERIRRMSKDNAVKDKCFNLIQDYKDLREMLNNEIHGLMRAMNDTLSRFQMLMEAQTTPEYVEKLTQEINAVQNELAEYADSHGKTETV